jgi:hypothetical protein
MNTSQMTPPSARAEGRNQDNLPDAQHGDPVEGSGFETEEPDRDFQERS